MPGPLLLLYFMMLTQKNGFQALRNMVRVVIPYPDPDFLPIPDPGVKKAPDPGSGSATLHLPLPGFCSYSYTVRTSNIEHRG
jgi:hypothetical protein